LLGNRDVVWENCIWEGYLRVWCKIGEDKQFLGLGLKKRECLKKDYGKKTYVLKDEIIKGLTKLRWYMNKKIRNVDNG